MSEPIAWAAGQSQITCEDGTIGTLCDPSPQRFNFNSPSTQVTAGTSNSKVFAEGKAVAVEGDAMIPHPDGDPCVPQSKPENHAPVTSLCAKNVFIGGKRAVRVGSKFNKGTGFDHTVSTGSSKVSVGGPSVSV